MAWIISSFLSMGVMPHVTHVENGCGDGGHFDLANWDGISRKRIFGFWGKKTTHELEKKKRHTEKCVFANFSGWWFQTFFIFTPIWGRFPIWLIFFRWVGSTTNQFTLRNTFYLDLRPLRNKVFGNFWKALFFTSETYQHFVFKKEGPDPEDFLGTPPQRFKQHKSPWKMGGSKTIRLLFFGALGLFFRGETVKLQVGLIKAWISVDFFAPWYAWSYDGRSKEVRRWIQNMSEIVLFFWLFLTWAMKKGHWLFRFFLEIILPSHMGIISQAVIRIPIKQPGFNGMP